MKRTRNKRKVIGYIRVSTIDQNVEKNEAAILKYANSFDLGKVKFISEKISGAKSWKKRKLFDVVNDMNCDDILIVPELSRLGRSLSDILEILNILSDKKVKVFSVKENFQINEDNMQSKIMRTLLGLFSEIERDLIIARTKEGLEAARAKGIVLGRPKGIGKSRLDKYKEEIIALIKNGSQRKFIAERYKVSPATLTHWLKKHQFNKIKSIP